MSSYTPLSQQRDNAKSVIRLRNSIPEKFFSYCFFHLSIVLDLNDNSLEEILKDAKPRRTITPLWRKKDSKCVYFGSQLTSESIASIFRLIEYLKRPENIEVEGLFRKTGSSARQTLLKEMLNKTTDLNLDKGQFSPHDIASVLKSFLKELPECLMVDKFATAHCQLCDMSKKSSLETNKKQKIKVLKAIQLLMLLLPEENTLLLECLLELLSKVVSVKKNLMTSKSLGTIFAPHLLCPKKLPPAEFHVASENFAELAAFIIDNADQVFQIPKELIRDIEQFWKEMENPNKTPRNFFDVSVMRNGISLKRSKSDEAVNTCVNFADRSQGAEDLTQTEIAKLYEHIQSMPDTSRKRKLLKQFAKTNHMNMDSCSRSSKENLYQRFSHFIKFPGRHTRSRNLGLFSDTVKAFRQNNRQEVDQLSYGLPSGTRQTRQASALLKKTIESSMQTTDGNLDTDVTPKSMHYENVDFLQINLQNDAFRQNNRQEVDQLSYGLPSGTRQTRQASTLWKKTIESSMQTTDGNLDIVVTPKSMHYEEMDFLQINLQNDKTPVNTKIPTIITEQSSPTDEIMISPLIHLIELDHSPKPVRSTRKRRSSEMAEAIITSYNAEEKTPVSSLQPPSIENEINFLPNLTNKKLRVIPATPGNDPDELPFFTPVTSFRKKPYRTIPHLRRRPIPEGLTLDIESRV